MEPLLLCNKVYLSCVLNECIVWYEFAGRIPPVTRDIRTPSEECRSYL